MSKEMFIASSPHETKVAVLENDSLVEVYYEREAQTSLVGGIYKGRVSRVLPGMQSAFVDVGLERDAFLYVSDFFEDAEEYDRIVADAEARVTRLTEGAQAPAPEVGAAAAPSEMGAAPVAEAVTVPEAHEEASPAVPTSAVQPTPEPAESVPAPAPAPPTRPESEWRDSRRREHRGRRWRGRGRGRYGEHRSGPRPEPVERAFSAPPSPPHAFEILPGESLAKYSSAAPAAEAPAATATPATEPEPTPEPPRAEPAAVPPVEPSRAPESGVETSAAEAVPPVEASAQPVSEGSPAAAAETPAVASASTPIAPETPAEHKPIWQRLVASVFGEGAGHSETAPTEAPTLEGHEAVEPEPRQERPAPASVTQGEVGSAEIAPTPVALASAGPTIEPGAAEPKREATLREPTQRPRFAPRRGRRGRRPPRSGSYGGSRPEPPRSSNYQPAQIAELLKEGQEIIVQIAKEPLGRKGARITSHVALPGRYLVYMPTVNHIGISRKIASEEERLRLRNIILENKGSLTGGFIVRTAGAGKSEEELKSDIKFLSTLWSDMRSEAEKVKAPALLHRDLDLVQRLLRDLLSPEFKTIWMDSEGEYARVVEFVNRCQPSLVGHVKLYTRETPIFEEFGIQSEIEKALKSKVWLKSGGYIVINQTEALVAIDVNTGKFVGKTNRLEDTIVKTNVDAVNEIVRQIRLRDLGGIIVVDFIDMDERRNRNKVIQALEDALRLDRAPTKIIAFHDFGLVAITRKRVKQSLERTLCEPCSYCEGGGWVKSPTTVCYEILAEVRKMKGQLEGDAVTLRVHPDVAKALKSREATILSELESLTHKNFIVKGDPLIHQERFEVY